MGISEILEPLAFGTPDDAAGNLAGVIADIENGRAFDQIALETLRRVYQQLAETKARAPISN